MEQRSPVPRSPETARQESAMWKMLLEQRSGPVAIAYTVLHRTRMAEP